MKVSWEKNIMISQPWFMKCLGSTKNKNVRWYAARATGGPDLRQVDENQGIGGYQMHLDIIDYLRGITTVLYILFLYRYEKSRFRIYIRTLECPLEDSWSIRDFFSYYTNPIGNHPINLIISISPYSILHTILHSLRPAFCGTLGGALRSTKLRSTAQVHLQWDYIQMHYARHSGISYINWTTIKFWFFGLISTELDHGRVAGKETCCRSTADNRFICTE